MKDVALPKITRKTVAYEREVLYGPDGRFISPKADKLLRRNIKITRKTVAYEREVYYGSDGKFIKSETARRFLQLVATSQEQVTDTSSAIQEFDQLGSPVPEHMHLPTRPFRPIRDPRPPQPNATHQSSFQRELPTPADLVKEALAAQSTPQPEGPKHFLKTKQHVERPSWRRRFMVLGASVLGFVGIGAMVNPASAPEALPNDSALTVNLPSDSQLVLNQLPEQPTATPLKTDPSLHLTQ